MDLYLGICPPLHGISCHSHRRRCYLVVRVAQLVEGITKPTGSLRSSQPSQVGESESSAICVSMFSWELMYNLIASTGFEEFIRS